LKYRGAHNKRSATAGCGRQRQAAQTRHAARFSNQATSGPRRKLPEQRRVHRKMPRRKGLRGGGGRKRHPVGYLYPSAGGINELNKRKFLPKDADELAQTRRHVRISTNAGTSRWQDMLGSVGFVALFNSHVPFRHTTAQGHGMRINQITGADRGPRDSDNLSLPESWPSQATSSPINS